MRSRTARTDSEVGVTVGDLDLSSFNEFVDRNHPASSSHHSTVAGTTF